MLTVVTLIIVKLIVVMISIVTPSVLMLSVIMLSVIRKKVVAPDHEKVNRDAEFDIYDQRFENQLKCGFCHRSLKEYQNSRLSVEIKKRFTNFLQFS